MHPAKDDDIGAGFGRLLREPERIADVIGQILYFRDLIIVSEDDGVQFFLQREDLPRKRVETRRRHGFANLQAVSARWSLDNIRHEQTLSLARWFVNTSAEIGSMFS